MRIEKRALWVMTGTLAVVLAAAGSTAWTTPETDGELAPVRAANAIDRRVDDGAQAMIERGRAAFRHSTFRSQTFFGSTLRLHEAVAELSPRQALAAGLKVDADAVPPEVLAAADLDDPATTAALLRLNAVVGVRGIFGADPSAHRGLESLGITCAFCHSTVDDSVAPGIGQRLDGWPNRDLDVGAILALSPDLRPLAERLRVDEPTVRTVLLSWGPGRFDASLPLDGKAFRPDGKTAAVLIPPAYGLAGVNLHTYTGWGSVPYWNALVANLEMNGKGTFFDPRLDDAGRFPLAAANGLGHKRDARDAVTDKLADLHFYQLALRAPAPPAGSFDAAAAARGAQVFNGKAACATCHVPPLYTDPGHNLHRPAEIGIDGFQAERSPTGRYRTTPLAGAWSRAKGGYYHDGRFATLGEVVDHYDRHRKLGLSPTEKADLVEFLKSL
jgi:Di-haem oxidoreductase, putative peroxidase